MLYINGVAITSCSLFEKNFSPEAVIIQKRQAADFFKKRYELLSNAYEVYSTFFSSCCMQGPLKYRISNETNYIEICKRLQKFKTQCNEYSSFSNSSGEFNKNEKISAVFIAVAEVVKKTELDDSEKQKLLCLVVTTYMIADKTFDQYPLDAKKAEQAFRISEKLMDNQELNDDEKAFVKEVVYSKKNDGKTTSVSSEKLIEKKDTAVDDSEKEIITNLKNAENKYSYNGKTYKFILSENPVFGQDDIILLKKITAAATALGVHKPIEIEFYNDHSHIPVYKETLQTGDYVYVSCLADKMFYVHPKISTTHKNKVERQGNTVIWKHSGLEETFPIDGDIVSVSAEKINEGFVLVFNEGAYYGAYSNVGVIGDYLLQEGVVEVGFENNEIFILLNNGYIYNSLNRRISDKKYIKLSDFMREDD